MDNDSLELYIKISISLVATSSYPAKTRPCKITFPIRYASIQYSHNEKIQNAKIFINQTRKEKGTSKILTRTR
jgi:hypothetical protein